jgi:acyl carrier protein
MNEISQAIRTILVNTLAVPATEVTSETSIRSLPNFDSVRILEVILEIEKRFDIEISDEATFNVTTVLDLEVLVASALGERRSVLA